MVSRRILAAAAALILLTSAASAQQQPDPATSQRLLEITKAQRAQFLELFTEPVARGDVLANELSRAQARIKELEKKQEEAATPASPR
jgi:hypothetical protein